MPCRLAYYCAAALIAIVAVFASYFLISAPPLHNLPSDVYDEHYWGKAPLEDDQALLPKDDKKINPFKLNYDEEFIKNLKERLNKTKLIEPLRGRKFEDGFNGNYLKKLLKYWINEFDWKKQIEYLNRYDQFTTQIEGVSVHFVHIKPLKETNVQPILLTNGWPSAAFHYYKMIDLLRKRADHFNLEFIIASRPGFGFSERPHRVGFSYYDSARIYMKLMKRLGHEKFFYSGEDWGSIEGRAMATLYPENLLGVHMSMPWSGHALEFKGILKMLIGAYFPSLIYHNKQEAKYFESPIPILKMSTSEFGYFYLHSTKPDTIASLLIDSPAGCAAYYLDNISAGLNRNNVHLKDGGLTKKFTLDELLTTLTIYVGTGNCAYSIRFHKECMEKALVHNQDITRIPVNKSVPFGFSVGEYEFDLAKFIPSKEYNMVKHDYLPKVGHFPSFENPKEAGDHLVKFISIVLSKSDKKNKIEKLDKSPAVAKSNIIETEKIIIVEKVDKKLMMNKTDEKAKIDKTDGKFKIDMKSKVKTSEKINKTEKVEKIDKKDKITKVDKVEKKEKVDKMSKAEKDKIDKDKKISKEEKEKIEKKNKTDKIVVKEGKEKVEQIRKEKIEKEKAEQIRKEKIEKEKAGKMNKVEEDKTKKLSKEKIEKKSKDDKIKSEKDKIQKNSEVTKVDKDKAKKLSKEEKDKIQKDKAEKEKIEKEVNLKAIKMVREINEQAKKLENEINEKVKKMEKIKEREIVEKMKREKEKAEKERAEKEKAEKEKAEKEKVEKEKAEKEKAEKEKAEKEKAEKEKAEKEKAEKEKAEKEKAEKEKAEKERAEKEKERAEKEKEKAEKEKAEKERAEKERAEKEKERAEKEKAEKEKAEKERAEKEKAEKEKAEKEKAEKERAEKEKAEKEKAEKEKAEKEKAEKKRAEKEKAEKEKAAKKIKAEKAKSDKAKKKKKKGNSKWWWW